MGTPSNFIRDEEFPDSDNGYGSVAYLETRAGYGWRGKGWYWWIGEFVSVTHSDVCGPFKTENDAIDDARNSG